MTKREKAAKLLRLIGFESVAQKNAENPVLGFLEEEEARFAQQMLSYSEELHSEFFSDEELDALIAFFESPVGVRFIASQNELEEKMNVRANEVFEEIVNRMECRGFPDAIVAQIEGQELLDNSGSESQATRKNRNKGRKKPKRQ